MQRDVAVLVIAAFVTAAGSWASACAQEQRTSEVAFKQVAPDLYFLFEFSSSNAGRPHHR